MRNKDIQTIAIQTGLPSGKGKETRHAEATVIGPLAVHQAFVAPGAPKAKRGNWKVTHVASGFSICPPLSKRAATAIAKANALEAIDQVGDFENDPALAADSYWTNTADTLVEEGICTDENIAAAERVFWKIIKAA